MDFRARRQLIILFAVFVIAAGIGFLIIRPYLPEPTCADEKKNQGEEEVDCGGPCLACAFKNQKNVDIFWTRFVKVRGNTYDVAAEVRNPNVKLGAASFRYEFKLFDGTGFLVASRRGTSFLYPGETAHLAEIGLTSGRVVTKTAIVLEDLKWMLNDSPRPDLIAGNREYVIEEGEEGKRSVIKALIANRTIQDVPNVVVSALAFDEDGNLLGVNRTRLEAVSANDVAAVRFVWPQAFPRSVSTILVEARSPAYFK